MNKKVLKFKRRTDLNSFDAKNNDLVMLYETKTIGDTLLKNGLKQTYPELKNYHDITRVEIKEDPTNEEPWGEEYEEYHCIKFNDDGSCVIDIFSVKDN